jgi:hypothetical protein
MTRQLISEILKGRFMVNCPIDSISLTLIPGSPSYIKNILGISFREGYLEGEISAGAPPA